MNKFKLQSNYKPAGDQPKAIKSLVDGLKKGEQHQTLLGVTGSGKTFTVANVIEKVQRPTLVIAHNKTLAAQLAQEYREFFPDNAVHYFVSYYDYYQPEAYMPVTDTYIEKEAQINAEIERLRHASTQAILSRKDVIIVASVSCIYGLGSPKEYEKENLKIKKGEKIARGDFVRELIKIHFERTNSDLTPGKVRAIGNFVEVMPVSEKFIVRATFDGDTISEFVKIDSVSRNIIEALDFFYFFPAKHFITDKDQLKVAIKTIEDELKDRLKILEKEGKLLEAERLKRRTKYDLALIREVGYCNGIENYSRHFSGKKVGEAPDTLLSYFPKDFLLVIDESHVTVPQIGGMYAGDRSRKETLVEHGFRLPSALDNRPLKFDEFEKRVGQTIYTSATPGKYELEKSTNIAEQIIRPTGLVDPVIDIRPITATTRLPEPEPRNEAKDSGSHKNYHGQVFDFIEEANKAIKKKGRVIATTLTKKMAEDLTDYLEEKGIKTAYVHSDIKTIERIEIISDFRRGKYDILVGVNLLREGLDMPEVTLIGILDADKEGFLRSETSLIQTIGRAARNVDGRVILYADQITGSMDRAIKETSRRRQLQLDYNKKHNITPKTIEKAIHDISETITSEHQKTVSKLLSIDEAMMKKNPKKLIAQKEKQMNAAVKILDFETAAILRDEIKAIEEKVKEK
ncbi:excinuclease ABC subunit UvrB [Candidatus Nomurabacteria bacterium]|nr:excinuclease ABC subunit UvrB [Candidatus Nomurabacteria bacterium]